MELLVPAIILLAMLLSGIGLAIRHRELQGLWLLLVPTLALTPFQLIWGVEGWTIVVVLAVMVWVTMFVAVWLRVRFAVGFLLSPAAFAFAFFIWYMLVRR